MFAFGICAGPSGKSDRIAVPAIQRVAPEAPVLVRTGQTSIFSAYNSMISEAAELEVEGLVLIHDDIELVDKLISDKLRAVFADPTVGLVGVIGGVNPRSLHWWHYQPHGRVQETGRLLDFGTEQQDVTVVDGVFLALSPAALATVRFDEQRYRGFHGYDADISREVLAAGLRVVTVDIDLLHHTVPGEIKNAGAHVLAALEWQSKWLVDDSPTTRLARRVRLQRARVQHTIASAAVRRGQQRVANALGRRMPSVSG